MKLKSITSILTSRPGKVRRSAFIGAFFYINLVMAQGTYATIPQGIKLWCLDDTSIGRENFYLFTDHYNEIDDVQTFQLFEGDVSTADKSTALLPFSPSSIPHRIHARLEVFEINKWNPGNEWYVMKGTWQVDTDIDIISIAQFKENNEEHPQIMVHIHDGDRITYSPYTLGARTVGTGFRNKPFDLMIRSNGQIEEVYFNGVREYSGVPYRNTPDTRNYFRWGLYSNVEMTYDAFMTVSDLYAGPEKDMPRDTYLETNGVIVIDAESQLRTTDWETETSIGGYLGTGYHRGTQDHFNDPGIGVITYPIMVGVSGRYQLQWRSRIGQGTVSTEHNDSWARMTDANKYPIALHPNSNTVEGSSQWAKVYMNQPSTWHWQASNVDNDPHSLSWDLEAGVLYHLQISVRSAEHCIDRIVLWDHARQDLADKSTGGLPNAAALDGLPLSSTDSSVVSPPASNTIFSNSFTQAEGFSDRVSVNGISGWSTITEPQWLAGDTTGDGFISCVNNSNGDVRAAHVLGDGFAAHSNMIEFAADFSLLGAPGDYSSAVDLFSIGITSGEQIEANGPTGIRVGLNSSKTFTARGRLGGSVAAYPTLNHSLSDVSNATVWLRLSIDPDINGVVQAEYSFDHFATSETTSFSSSAYGSGNLYFQLTAEDASKNGGSGIAINSITVSDGTEVILPPVEPPVLVVGPIGNDIGFTWSNDLFRVQSRTTLLDGEWIDVPGATNSPFVIKPTNAGEYYRLIQQ